MCDKRVGRRYPALPRDKMKTYQKYEESESTYFSHKGEI